MLIDPFCKNCKYFVKVVLNFFLSVFPKDDFALRWAMTALLFYTLPSLFFCRLSEPSLVVQSCETIYPPLILTSKALTVPAFDISQDQLVHKVMYP